MTFPMNQDVSYIPVHVHVEYFVLQANTHVLLCTTGYTQAGEGYYALKDVHVRGLAP